MRSTRDDWLPGNHAAGRPSREARPQFSRSNVFAAVDSTPTDNDDSQRIVPDKKSLRSLLQVENPLGSGCVAAS